jgi:hypothetical protein
LKAGKPEQARASLHLALTKNPDTSTAQDVKRAMAEIGSTSSR